MFYELIENLSIRINVIRFVNIDQEVIQVHNYKNILLFCHYLIEISLEAC